MVKRYKASSLHPVDGVADVITSMMDSRAEVVLSYDFDNEVLFANRYRTESEKSHERKDADIDRLTSDKARMLNEISAISAQCNRAEMALAAEQESNTFLNNLHTVDQDRLRALDAALQAVRDARLDWAMVCPCSCDACDRFYESVRVATSAETKGEL